MYVNTLIKISLQFLTAGDDNYILAYVFTNTHSLISSKFLTGLFFKEVYLERKFTYCRLMAKINQQTNFSSFLLAKSLISIWWWFCFWADSESH